MLAPVGQTLETTYALQLRQPDGTWRFELGEYTSADDCHGLAAQMFGGSFAAADMHRVVEIKRTVR